MSDTNSLTSLRLSTFINDLSSEMKLTKVTIICSWLATLTFMSGFLVFIVKPWSWVQKSLDSSNAPLAENLIDNVNTDNWDVEMRRKRRKNKLKKFENKEERKLKRRARMLKDQEEYRQWRRDVIAGVEPEKDPIDTAIEKLWSELFDEELDVNSILEDYEYEYTEL